MCVHYNGQNECCKIVQNTALFHRKVHLFAAFAGKEDFWYKTVKNSPATKRLPSQTKHHKSNKLPFLLFHSSACNSETGKVCSEIERIGRSVETALSKGYPKSKKAVAKRRLIMQLSVQPIILIAKMPYFLTRRRAIPRPARPSPSIASVAGSGTTAGSLIPVTEINGWLTLPGA